MSKRKAGPKPVRGGVKPETIDRVLDLSTTLFERGEAEVESFVEINNQLVAGIQAAIDESKKKHEAWRAEQQSRIANVNTTVSHLRNLALNLTARSRGKLPPIRMKMTAKELVATARGLLEAEKIDAEGFEALLEEVLADLNAATDAVPEPGEPGEFNETEALLEDLDGLEAGDEGEGPQAEA